MLITGIAQQDFENRRHCSIDADEQIYGSSRESNICSPMYAFERIRVIAFETNDCCDRFSEYRRLDPYSIPFNFRDEL
jgi:hypothetical protein